MGFCDNDYYPGGMLMPGRKFSQGAASYRYGFGGQEKSDEIKGEGNSYTAEFWEYDPRLVRRWNVDPVKKEHESPYASFANNPIWFSDVIGKDTSIRGTIKAQSEIMKKPGNPSFVPPGVKLESTSNIDAQIQNGKFTSVKLEVKPQEFESPVLGGIKPKFTKIINYKAQISKDGQTASIHYEAVTQLAGVEVVGQWVRTLFDDGTIQTNIITVTQSVDIILKMGSITTTFDGSTFPESRYNASYSVDTKAKVHTGQVSATLPQSSYYESVKSKKFREKNHPQKRTQILTY